VGRLRRKPDSLFADRGYDHDIYRDQVRARGIVPAIARRGTKDGTGLSTHRRVVERSFAWLRPHGRPFTFPRLAGLVDRQSLRDSRGNDR
jgi:hypothetical protein